ncbi:MAG TPA: DUF4326 domain-containing protein [Spirillospora sp.]|nr:DUF4326 domain-containing protein [Spirillospora sp.]
MSEPRRIQRRRTKGWRMPEGAVYVGRPTKWGNPFIVHSEEIVVHDDGRDWWCPLESGGARQAAVDMFAMWLAEAPRLWIAQTELAGRDLACWCPLDQPCHADVLLRIANGGAPC